MEFLALQSQTDGSMDQWGQLGKLGIATWNHLGHTKRAVVPWLAAATYALASDRQWDDPKHKVAFQLQEMHVVAGRALALGAQVVQDAVE